MIKIGCAAYSYREYLAGGRMSYEDFIEEVYRMRLDGVEITSYWLPSRDESYLKRLKILSAIRGLPVSCVGISTNFCKPGLNERESMVKAVEEGLRIARVLGSQFLRVFGGSVPNGHNEAEAIQWVVDSLKKCVKRAEDEGIVIALENHGGVTARAENVLKIINLVDSPWLKVNLDLGNYVEETYEEIAETIPYAVHIHGKISIANKKTLVDYLKIKDILNNHGYNGFISIEYEGTEDPKVAVSRFAEHLLSLFH